MSQYKYTTQTKAKSLAEIYTAIASCIDVEGKKPLNPNELVGKVMQATKGHYNPALIRRAISRVM